MTTQTITPAQFIIKRRDGVGETKTVSILDLLAACAEMAGPEKHALDVKQVGDEPPAVETVATAKMEPPPPPAPVNSTWTHQIVDESAKTRIEAQHAALTAAGVTVHASEQLYATGTRMADIGYQTQENRKRDHEKQVSAREACDALIATVKAEHRKDVVISAAEFRQGLHANGSISINGYRLGSNALRGLASRLDSPMKGYIDGIIDRIRERGTATEDKRDANVRDMRAILSVIAHECAVNPDARFMMRLREAGVGGKPDCYAMLGEGYGIADAPDACYQLARKLPQDARATWSYDPATTTWELRPSVWTKTPVHEQAVGEAFEGYVSFQSRDNGTSKFRGGGGVTLLRCLNASTYSADDSTIARIHRGNVLYEVEKMLAKSLRAIDILVNAWGDNREAVIEVPAEVNGKCITLEQAIPGFYMSLLRGKSGKELANVLPGRTREHAVGLARTYYSERRDSRRLVRSDLAQGWTRYIQDQPADLRRDAEMAIGDWLVSKKEVTIDETYFR